MRSAIQGAAIMARFVYSGPTAPTEPACRFGAANDMADFLMITPIRAPLPDLAHQQWAWEFLRRNPTYRRAHDVISALDETQRKIVSLLEGGLSERVELIHLCLLPLGLLQFSIPVMIDAEDGSRRQLGEIPYDHDLLLGKFAYKVARDIQQWAEKGNKLRITIRPEFTRSAFCISNWLSPEVSPLPTAMLEKFWVLEDRHRAGLVDLTEADEVLSALAGHQDIKKFGRVFNSVNSSPLAVEGKGGQRFFPAAYMEITESLVPLGHFDFRVTFDLTLPLQPQLRAAEKAVSDAQGELFDAGLLARLPRNGKGRVGSFQQYLDLLDLHESGLDAAAIREARSQTAQRTYIQHKRGKRVTHLLDRRGDTTTRSELAKVVNTQLERAILLRDTGYRGIAFSASP